MVEAEEVIVEEVVVEGAEEAHLVDEGVEEGVEEGDRRETETIVLENNLTHSDVNSFVICSASLKVLRRKPCASLVIHMYN